MSPNRFLPAIMIIATPAHKVRVEIANMANDNAPIYIAITKATVMPEDYRNRKVWFTL